MSYCSDISHMFDWATNVVINGYGHRTVSDLRLQWILTHDTSHHYRTNTRPSLGYPCILTLRRQIPPVYLFTKDDRCVPCYAHRWWTTWQCRYEGGDSGYGLHQQWSGSETEVRTALPLQSARKHSVRICTLVHGCLTSWKLFSHCLSDLPLLTGNSDKGNSSF